MPPASPLGSGPISRSKPGQSNDESMDLVIAVTRLLDMPEEKTLFGTAKNFVVRVFDEDEQELACSGEIAPARGPEAESIPVSQKAGTIRLHTRSQLIFLQVEHVGGARGANKPIGRCQIHRLDPRSSQIWPYALSELGGGPANCGIELKVVERQPLQLGGSQPPTSAPSSAPGASRSGRGKGSAHRSVTPPEDEKLGVTGMQDMTHGVSALLEFDKVTDLAYPNDDGMDRLLITVLDEEKNKELRKVGPFVAADQRSSSRRLVMANCKGTRVFAHAPLHFGGDAEEGAMFVKVSLHYVRSTGETEHIGVSDPIKVSWRPAEKQYYEIRQKSTRKVLGGIYLTHRLMTEGEMAGVSGGGASEAQSGRPPPKIGAAVEAHLRVSGRTGNFPPGTREEAFEQAAINCEAQNRALLQRCKVADPTSHDEESHVRTVNGYREWDSLDSLFASMGPNPLALSEELGPTVARSFNDRTTMLKELIPKLGPTASVGDEQFNLRLINMLFKQDPFEVSSTLRPVVCKDPNDIAANQDMRWCPDPPVYAPLKNMSEQDKETMRLACFDPRQNAKIMFADANPNYRIDEDIWGVLSDYKTARSLVVPKPEYAMRRVKDDCIMA